jgi:hypothetical protein
VNQVRAGIAATFVTLALIAALTLRVEAQTFRPQGGGSATAVAFANGGHIEGPAGQTTDIRGGTDPDVDDYLTTDPISADDYVWASGNLGDQAQVRAQNTSNSGLVEILAFSATAGNSWANAVAFEMFGPTGGTGEAIINAEQVAKMSLRWRTNIGLAPASEWLSIDAAGINITPPTTADVIDFQDSLGNVDLKVSTSGNASAAGANVQWVDPRSTLAATTCDAAAEVGQLVLYSRAASNTTSFCACVQTAAATFAWQGIHASANCTP